MRVLVACEFSGEVRRAFAARGHDAWSVDLLPSEVNSGHHIVGDVFAHCNHYGTPLLAWGWDLLVAFPPCTYLCNSGVRWLYKNGQRHGPRWSRMIDAAAFFEKLLHYYDIPKIALENPIMHKHARELIIGCPSQIIQPWQFGHGETKATCLWLKSLPLLKPTNIVEGRAARVHRVSASLGADRWKERSRTLPGIAQAMAEQWGRQPMVQWNSREVSVEKFGH